MNDYGCGGSHVLVSKSDGIIGREVKPLFSFSENIRYTYVVKRGEQFADSEPNVYLWQGLILGPTGDVLYSKEIIGGKYITSIALFSEAYLASSCSPSTIKWSKVTVKNEDGKELVPDGYYLDKSDCASTDQDLGPRYLYPSPPTHTIIPNFSL